MTLNTGYRLEPLVDKRKGTFAWNIERRDGDMYAIVKTFIVEPGFKATDDKPFSKAHLDAVALLSELVTGKKNDWTHRGDFGPW